VSLAADAPFQIPTAENDRPFLAIWRDDDGFVSKSRAPYLRVAIWDDGRVVFTKDPTRWGHELLHGRIAPYRVERLKKALLETGVFESKGYCYLGPDMPTDCVMIRLGEKKQMLYWVEGQTSWMESKPHRMDFVRCWKAVNGLALVACPDQFQSVSEPFKRPPDSWYLKRAIQSE
jgi:hypothetical protein